MSDAIGRLIERISPKIYDWMCEDFKNPVLNRFVRWLGRQFRKSRLIRAVLIGKDLIEERRKPDLKQTELLALNSSGKEVLREVVQPFSKPKQKIVVLLFDWQTQFERPKDVASFVSLMVEWCKTNNIRIFAINMVNCGNNPPELQRLQNLDQLRVVTYGLEDPGFKWYQEVRSELIGSNILIAGNWGKKMREVVALLREKGLSIYSSYQLLAAMPTPPPPAVRNVVGRDRNWEAVKKMITKV